MPTQCSTEPLEFETHGRRRVVAAFDGGPITSAVGLLLLHRVERGNQGTLLGKPGDVVELVELIGLAVL